MKAKANLSLTLLCALLAIGMWIPVGQSGSFLSKTFVRPPSWIRNGIASLQSLTWNIYEVDSPSPLPIVKSFLSDRSLRLDARGNPHIAFNGGYLYYASLQSSGWVIEQVDTVLVDGYPALVFDQNGLPHISYHNAENGNLKYARWTGSNWQTQTVDNERGRGYFSSIALDNNGNPHISYDTMSGLKYAYWTGNAWQIQAVDTGIPHTGLSMALDTTGIPHILYQYNNGSSDVLRYAYWTGSAWMIQSVDNADDIYSPSAALDHTNKVHVSYYAYTGSSNQIQIKYASLAGGSWQIQSAYSAACAGVCYIDGGTSLSVDGAGKVYIAAYDMFGVHLLSQTSQGWDHQMVADDSAPDLSGISLALGSEGVPQISYGFGSGLYGFGQLKYVLWTGSQWQTQIVREFDLPYRLEFSSLAIDTNLNPHISYYNYFGDTLKYTRRTGSSWQFQTVETGAGKYPSLHLDELNNPHILYYDRGSSDYNSYYRYAYWNGTAWDFTNVPGSVKSSDASCLSSALDNSGHPHLSYCDSSNRWVIHAHWTGSNWLVESIPILGDVGNFTSLALGSSQVYIFYYDPVATGLYYLRSTGTGSWQPGTVDSVGDVGHYPSSAIDIYGRPHVSYYDVTNADLKYAYWTGSTWQIQTVDNAGDVGKYTSLALDSSGNPHISYHDATQGDLKYARWTGSNWQIQTVDTQGFTGVYSSLAIDNGDQVHISYINDLFTLYSSSLMYASSRSQVSQTPTPTLTPTSPPTPAPTLIPTPTPGPMDKSLYLPLMMRN